MLVHSGRIGCALLITCGTLLGTFWDLAQAGAVRKELYGKADFSFAEHTTAPQNPGSERFLFFVGEKLRFSSRWSAVASGQLWFEGLYATDPSYPGPIRDQDFRDARLQDTYIQYLGNNIQFRAGNQQIVWGETFGGFYADIVNPKDFRQNVPLDQAEIRLSTPAVSATFTYKHFAAQAIYLPLPIFDILPLPGSDYQAPLNGVGGFKTVVINRERSLPLFAGGGEGGGRISQTISGDVASFDISAFYLSHFDHNPYYEVAPETVSKDTLILNERHGRIYSTGMSLALDLSGFVLRSEGVLNNFRQIPTYTNDSLSFATTNELAYTHSLDFPTWNRLNLTIQYSESRLTDSANYYGRLIDEQTVATHIQWSFFESHQLVLLTSYNLIDMGWRHQLDYSRPLSPTTDMHAGIEDYEGPSNSQYGGIRRASRVYALLRLRLG